MTRSMLLAEAAALRAQARREGDRALVWMDRAADWWGPASWLASGVAMAAQSRQTRLELRAHLVEREAQPW